MKQIWDWIKSLKIIHFLSLLGSALVLSLAALSARENRHKAKKLEKKAESLLTSRVSSKIQKGKQLTEKANLAKDRAVQARMRAEGQLDKLGAKNEDLDAIADRFNSRRLRK